MNLLKHESSPYLLQHANNPVHWHPWSETALAESKKTDKPILVSIGYSACHWCHVMERESFENDATAAIMNEHFVCIKIDREERPDLDHIYMDAVQAMTGSGGWPLNVFLTPDAKPFYGGTYFPPVKAFNRASWSDVLLAVSEAWQTRRNEMEAQAENFIAHISAGAAFSDAGLIGLKAGEVLFSKADVETIAANLLVHADKIDGGFGKAPKFPQSFSINCLLLCAHFLKDNDALAQAELSLQKMYRGGIYDVLGGGLCRYSTDEKWLVPHFEKMLYDNALFIAVLSDAYLLTKKEIYAEAINETCRFLFAEMKHKDGGFYSALDADSEGKEGEFYVWTADEIDEELREKSGPFKLQFNVLPAGNFSSHEAYHQHKNILHREAEADPGFLEEADLTHAKETLLKARAKKIRPGTDDKILLGWNALLVKAFSKAYAAAGVERYRDEAVALYAFIQNKFRDKNGNYFHTYKEGTAKYPAFLDDLAYLCEAAIFLQEITGTESYLNDAKRIAEKVLEQFSDEAGVLFYFTAEEQADIPVRKVEFYDGAVPSGNGVMAANLLRLGLLFDEPKFRSRAEKMLLKMKNAALKHPSSFGVWAESLIISVAGILEIAVTGTAPGPLMREILSRYIPNRVLQSAREPSNFPLLAGKPINDESQAYLCKDYACSAPVTGVKDLMRLTAAGSF